MAEYYMDPRLKENLAAAKPHVLKNWDMCFIVSGIEGAGKSTFAFQIAHQLSAERFTLDHVCLTPKDFMDKITKHEFLQPGDTLVLDEGFMINSRASMSKLNREFLAILSECRQKQLFLVIICPNFFDLDKNLALWRSRGLFYIDHVSLKRGYFKFWSYEKKKKLYVLGKKFFEYHKVKYDFRGTFTKFMPVDEEAYKALKLKAFENRETPTAKEDHTILQRAHLLYLLRQMGLKWKEISAKMQENGLEVHPEALRGCIRRAFEGRAVPPGQHTNQGFSGDDYHHTIVDPEKEKDEE